MTPIAFKVLAGRMTEEPTSYDDGGTYLGPRGRPQAHGQGSAGPRPAQPLRAPAAATSTTAAGARAPMPACATSAVASSRCASASATTTERRAPCISTALLSDEPPRTCASGAPWPAKEVIKAELAPFRAGIRVRELDIATNKEAIVLMLDDPQSFRDSITTNPASCANGAARRAVACA